MNVELKDLEGAPLLQSTGTVGLRSRNCFLHTLTFFSAIGGFLFGYDTGVVGGAMLVIREDWQDFSDVQQSLAVSITMAGCMVAVLLSSELTDRAGRQPVIIAGSLIFTLGSALMAVAQGLYRFETLLAGRFIVGVAVGLASMAIPLYIAEAAPPQSRGALVTLNNVFVTGGQFFANVVDALLSKYDFPHGWRYMLGLGVVPAVIQFVGFLFMPESPRWLAVHKSEEETRAVLQRIRGKTNVDSELSEIRRSAKSEQCEQTSGLTAIMKTPSLRRALRLGVGLQMIQQFTGINTVMYYCPTIFVMAGFSDPTTAIWLTAGVSGIGWLACCMAIPLVDTAGRRMLTLSSLGMVAASLFALGFGFYYSHSVSPPCMEPPIAPSRLPRLVNAVQCAAYTHCFDCVSDPHCGYCADPNASQIVSGFCLAGNATSASSHLLNLTDAPPSLLCVQGMNSSTVMPTWHFQSCPPPSGSRENATVAEVGGVISLVATGAYLASFQPGMGPMPWAINAEIYPLHARSSAIAAATMCNWTANLIVSHSFLALAQAVSSYGAFWCYGAVAVLGWIWLYKALPETAGLSLEQIEHLFEAQDRFACLPAESLAALTSEGENAELGGADL